MCQNQCWDALCLLLLSSCHQTSQIRMWKELSNTVQTNVSFSCVNVWCYVCKLTEIWILIQHERRQETNCVCHAIRTVSVRYWWGTSLRLECGETFFKRNCTNCNFNGDLEIERQGSRIDDKLKINFSIIRSKNLYEKWPITSRKYRRSIIEQWCRSDGAKGGTIIGISFQSSRFSLSADCWLRVISRMTRSSSFCLPWALNIVLWKETKKRFTITKRMPGEYIRL